MILTKILFSITIFTQKRLGSGEKLPGYRDRLKNELERHKRKVELLEQREREDKAEIQRLKNQILTRFISEC